MANISNEISEIQAASRGSEVRQAIVDILNKVNTGVLPVVSSSDAGKILAVNNNGAWEAKTGDLVPRPTGTKSITENGTHDVTNYASANVNVQSSFSASDEGKVVSSGALVSQTARSSEITENGTYDTTVNNSVTVNVSGGGGGTPETITVATSVSGGYNGGAVISISFDGTVVFTATGNSPYNLDYNNKSASITTDGGNTVTITVTPPPSSSSNLGITIASEKQTIAYSIKHSGSNSSYGYSFSETEDLTVAGMLLISKSITENGTYTPANDDADGYSSVVVNVRGGVVDAKTVIANGLYSAHSDDLDGYSSVYVQVPQTSNAQGILSGTDDPTSVLGSDGEYYYKRKRISANADGWITTIDGWNNVFKNVSHVGNEFITNAKLIVTALRVYRSAAGTDVATGSLRIGTLTDILASVDNISIPGSQWVYGYLQEPITLNPNTHYVVQAINCFGILSPYNADAASYCDADMASYVGRRSPSAADQYPGTLYTSSYLAAVDFICTMPERYVVEHEYYKENGVWTQIR